MLCQLVIAQHTSSNKRAQSAYNNASVHLRSNKLADAAIQLESAVKYDPAFATAYQQLGDIYRRLQRYEKAIQAYERVLAVHENLTSLTYYGLGESYLFTGHYEKAEQSLRKYLQIGSLSDQVRKRVEKYLADCQFAVSHKGGASVVVSPVQGGVNTQNDEYFPQLTADNMRIIFTRKQHNQENFYESIWLGGKWSEALKLQGAINSHEFNEGAHCISPDGKFIFFTGCNRPDGLGSCDIYISKKENGIWSAPHNLGAPINTKGWEAQPSISPDGRTLYFVSNRAGGQGGYDIWKSTLVEDGKWSAPVNLGPDINTAFDEGSPYIHADNKTLYFSSNGWPGFGRKDIYKSSLGTDGRWHTPENLGYPINNHFDQISLHVSMDGQIAHLSAQDKDLQQDIYMFALPAPVRPQAVAFINGKVSDAKTDTPLGATITVTDNGNSTIVFNGHADYLDGRFLATLPVGSSYAVHVQHLGYLFDSKNYDLGDEKTTNQEYLDTILLKPIEANSTATLNNVYFEINQSRLLSESLAELEMLVKFLAINPSISIELSGHTDHTGSREKNQILSENRAKAVVGYLVQKGVSPSRLKYVGYGDRMPIADNTKEEGRRLNRRTEVKILSK